MRIWFLFELLLFFVLLAFAAGRSVGPKGKQEAAATAAAIGVTTLAAAVIPAAVEAVTVPGVVEAVTVPGVAEAVTSAAEVISEVTEEVVDPDGPSRFCKCANLECNCCREFKLPLIPITTSGCANLMYLKGDKMALTMRVGNVVLRNVTVSGKKSKPACVGLPGGFSQFCGRVYGVSRKGETFKACLGLELRALTDLEASMRVSCFRFSPKGVTLEPAPPLPPSPVDEDEDDDGFFGLGGGGDDEDEDEDDEDDDEGLLADDDEAEEEEDEDYPEADAAETGAPDADYTGFSALGSTFGDFFGGFFDDGTGGTKKKKKPVVSALRPAKPIADDKIDIIEENLSSAKPMPVKSTVSTIVVTTQKPYKIDTTSSRPIIRVATTTEREPTTIKLSPTSSVKVTMTASTTQRAEIPDPIKSSASEETKEEDSDEDDKETTSSTTEDNETFSSELEEAIKGVEEELSSVADIVDEPEGEEESDEEESGEEEESTGKPSAVVQVSSTTEDDELDLLDEVEQLAGEVSIADVEEDDDYPPQIGVPIDGEPRGNATTVTTESTIKSRKSTGTITVLKRTNRVSRHHA